MSLRHSRDPGIVVRCGRASHVISAGWMLAARGGLFHCGVKQMVEKHIQHRRTEGV
jgi:hypothetical protein